MLRILVIFIVIGLFCKFISTLFKENIEITKKYRKQINIDTDVCQFLEKFTHLKQNDKIVKKILRILKTHYYIHGIEKPLLKSNVANIYMINP